MFVVALLQLRPDLCLSLLGQLAVFPVKLEIVRVLAGKGRIPEIIPPVPHVGPAFLPAESGKGPDHLHLQIFFKQDRDQNTSLGASTLSSNVLPHDAVLPIYRECNHIWWNTVDHRGFHNINLFVSCQAVTIKNGIIHFLKFFHCCVDLCLRDIGVAYISKYAVRTKYRNKSTDISADNTVCVTEKVLALKMHSLFLIRQFIRNVLFLQPFLFNKLTEGLFIIHVILVFRSFLYTVINCFQPLPHCINTTAILFFIFFPPQRQKGLKFLFRQKFFTYKSIIQKQFNRQWNVPVSKASESHRFIYLKKAGGDLFSEGRRLWCLLKLIF